MTSSNLGLRIQLAEELIQYANKCMLDAFHSDLSIEEKSSNDYVTEVDQKIESYARSSVLKAFPDDGFYGEEQATKPSANGYEWVMDPLDGTNNFIRGWPLFGCQIAIIENETTVYSVISRPATKEVYRAKKDQGAYYENTELDEKRLLSVSDRPLSESIVVFDTKVGKDDSPSTKVFASLVDSIAMVRVFGVAVFDLPSVAEGSAEMLVTRMANKYDIAAGKLLIEEAGGEVYTKDGADVSLEDKLIMLSSKRIKNDVLSLLD